jgi:hypothetical protein
MQEVMQFWVMGERRIDVKVKARMKYLRDAPRRNWRFSGWDIGVAQGEQGQTEAKCQPPPQSKFFCRALTDLHKGSRFKFQALTGIIAATPLQLHHQCLGNSTLATFS